MKRFLRNIAILVFPFLLMIIVNEIVRPLIKENPYSISDITAINSDVKVSDKCTWNCHNNTNYCKENHVKYMKPFYKYSDPIYFGMIGLFMKTGNYGLANIIFLVVLAPFLIWFFTVKSLNIQGEIKTYKKHQK